ncbi:MAG: hypothetical protein IKV15_00760 [Bacteroidaceae bacterium]|nr:hypothetical protein [Bacteroidaceae bacterium]
MAKEINETKREAFLRRMTEREPNLNLDDEDAYYGYMDNMVTEYDDYRTSSDAMRKNMDHSPALAEMFMAAREEESFDPVLWMVRNKGLDLDALRDDPEYAEKVTEAHNEWLAKRAKSDEINEQAAANMPKSIEAVKAKAAELGLTDEQADEIMGEIYQMGDNLILGIIPVNIFEMLAKGKTYDKDVEEAREVGIAQGLETKVTDKLRSMPKTNEQVRGRQMPVREAEPKKEEKHMFLA